jgi:hypothetical protein
MRTGNGAAAEKMKKLFTLFSASVVNLEDAESGFFSGGYPQ